MVQVGAIDQLQFFVKSILYGLTLQLPYFLVGKSEQNLSQVPTDTFKWRREPVGLLPGWLTDVGAKWLGLLPKGAAKALTRR